MIKQLSLTLALLFTVVLVAQDNKKLYLLEADSTWLKEIIKFPFGFAPRIEFEGYEDLRFAKNWSLPEGPEFLPMLLSGLLISTNDLHTNLSKKI